MTGFYLKLVLLYAAVGFLFLVPVLQQRERLNAVRPLENRLGLSEYVEGLPVRLTIPRIGIDVAVTAGAYNQKTWDLSPTSALFAEGSVIPNNRSGNTLLYGHNTASVFLKTAGLRKGDTLFVFTNSRNIFMYSYDGDALVLPTDTSIFAYRGSPQATLLTCNGFINERRRLMFFRFLKVV